VFEFVTEMKQEKLYSGRRPGGVKKTKNETVMLLFSETVIFLGLAASFG
jgi:hypothetical protein